MPVGKPIYLYETELFKDWLQGHGLEWPESPIQQENIIAQFMREGHETARKEKSGH